MSAASCGETSFDDPTPRMGQFWPDDWPQIRRMIACLRRWRTRGLNPNPGLLRTGVIVGGEQRNGEKGIDWQNGAIYSTAFRAQWQSRCSELRSVAEQAYHSESRTVLVTNAEMRLPARPAATKKGKNSSWHLGARPVERFFWDGNWRRESG